MQCKKGYEYIKHWFFKESRFQWICVMLYQKVFFLLSMTICLFVVFLFSHSVACYFRTGSLNFHLVSFTPFLWHIYGKLFSLQPFRNFLHWEFKNKTKDLKLLTENKNDLNTKYVCRVFFYVRPTLSIFTLSWSPVCYRICVHLVYNNHA